MFPLIRVSGSAHERGKQYGVQARDRIHRSITAYAEVFQHHAGWDWSQATTQARRFLPAIEDFAPQYVDELTGTATGAGVTVDDILAINVRTEVMNAARVRNAMALLSAPAECSAVATTSSAGRAVVGQNWDWAPFATDTVVVLQAEPDEGPAYVTVVEAGLLAKLGVNSDGLAVLTNALSCTEDRADPGVPYHVLLRALLDCGTTAEAVHRTGQATHAASANYLLADRSGAVADVEARPGSTQHRLHADERGVLLHTNHFVAPDFDAVDYTALVPSTTRVRLDRLANVFATADAVDDIGGLAAALSDHANDPDSLCRHPDPLLPGVEQAMTVASAVVDLADGRVLVADGPPCERGFVELDCSWLWG